MKNLTRIEKTLLVLLVPALVFLHVLLIPQGSYTPLYSDIMFFCGAWLWCLVVVVSATSYACTSGMETSFSI